MTHETEGSEGTTADGSPLEVTIPIERWETAESSAREPVAHSNGDASAAPRWRRSLVVLTTSDADTSGVGA